VTFTSCVRGDLDPEQQESDSIPITGIEHKSIQLECSLLTSDPPRVRWLDYVYNSDPNPRLIFDSWNNSELRVDQEHPNRLSYEVCFESNWLSAVAKVTIEQSQTRCNVNNDKISQILAIIAQYGEPAIVNSAQRFRQDGVEHFLMVKLYQHLC